MGGMPRRGQRILTVEFWDGLWAFDQRVLNTAVFWRLFRGTFMSHVHTSAVAIFLVREAAIQCLEIRQYLIHDLRFTFFFHQGQTANSLLESHFCCLDSRSRFLIHDSTLTAINQNRNINDMKMDSFTLVQSSRFSTTDRRS